MTGRLTQLGRQLRKLRHIVGSPTASSVTTLRRATQLACDLACEQAAVEDAQAAFHDLGVRGIVEPGLAERLASHAASIRAEGIGDRALPIGRDLDTFLRTLELGAPARDLPFEPLVEAASSTKPDSAAGVPISGRILELEVRGGRAAIAIDAQPIKLTVGADEGVTSFALAAAPTSTPEIEREGTGVTRVIWANEKLAIELAADFRRASVSFTPGV